MGTKNLFQSSAFEDFGWTKVSLRTARQTFPTVNQKQAFETGLHKLRYL